MAVDYTSGDNITYIGDPKDISRLSNIKVGEVYVCDCITEHGGKSRTPCGTCGNQTLEVKVIGARAYFPFMLCPCGWRKVRPEEKWTGVYDPATVPLDNPYDVPAPTVPSNPEPVS